MPWTRVLLRMVTAVLASAVVSAGLVAAFGAIALAIEWDVPQAQELLGPSTVYDRDGVALHRFRADVERRPVPLEAISANLRDAVVATEDHRFYTHDGVDPFSLLRAVVSNVRTGAIEQGGSTLTQQYVKNAYVGTDRTLARKIREAVVSIQLEKDLTKDEILGEYLNRAYFGDGAYGAEAAARSYFGVPASDLTLSQAAVLASTLSAPSRRSPRADPAGAAARRDLVLDELVRYGIRPAAEVEAARLEPIALAPTSTSPPAAPFVIEQVRTLMEAAYGSELLYNGGLSITVSIDLDRQFALERAVIPHLPADPGYDVGAVAVDPRTGDVLAAWSGRDFALRQVDLALGGSTPGRQPGSAFKPVVLVTALEGGMSLDTTYAAPRSIDLGGGYTVTGGGCGGRCSLLDATAQSVNTVYAQLGRDVGVADFTQMARRLGMAGPFTDTDLSQALGTAQVTPLDLASAYATLANDGVACPARLVTSVRDADGTERADVPDPRQPTPEERAAWLARYVDQGYPPPAEDLGRCYRAVAPSVARQATLAMADGVESGTGRRAGIGRPQAGKTGTSQDHRDLWFSGYTPDLSLAVTLGHVPTEIPVRGLPGCRGACCGGDVAAPIWRDVATVLLEGVPPAAFSTEIVDERVEGVSPDRRRLGEAGGGAVPPPRPTATRAAQPPRPPAPPPPAPSPSPSAEPVEPSPSPPPPVPEPDPSPPPDQEPEGLIPGLLGGDDGVGGPGPEVSNDQQEGSSAPSPPPQG